MIAAILYCCPYPGFSQYPEVITPYNGFPMEGVLGILSDKLGKPVVLDSNGVVHVFTSGRLRRSRVIPPQFVVTSMTKDADGLIWLLDQKGSLAAYDPASFRFEPYFALKTIMGPVEKVMPVKGPGVILLTKNHSIYSIRRNNGLKLPDLTALGRLPEDTQPLVAFLQNEKPYILTSNGEILAYTETLSQWNISDGLSQYNVVWVDQADASLWFLTKNSGLIYEVQQNIDTIRLPELPGQDFHRIYRSHDGSLWLIGKLGVYIIRTENGISTVSGYSRLPAGKAYKDYHFTREGILWSVEGQSIRKIKASDLKNGIRIPQVWIDSIFSEAGPVKRSISGGGTVEIMSSEISFQIGTTDSSNVIRYTMSKDDAGWTDWTNDRWVHFSDLKPGKYTFQMEVLHPSGSKASLRTAVVVLHPFWGRIGRYSLAMGMVLLLIVVVYSLQQLIRKRKQAKELKMAMARIKEVEAEMKALQLQINPHFLFNFLSGIQGLISLGERDKAIKYTGKAARLMRKLLDASRSSWHPIGEELEMMREYVTIENFRQGKNIAFRVSGRVDHTLLIPPLFFQPLIENAMKHAFTDRKTGTIEMDLSYKGRYIQVIISDSGRGAEGNSVDGREKAHAMDILRERLSLYVQASESEVIKLTSDPGEGTTVSFVLPYKKAGQ